MSITSIQGSNRQRKGRAIAAAPDQIFEVTRNRLYLVMSQTHTDEAYEVSACGPYWKCTCRDHTEHGACCKHAYAIKAVIAAETELDQWEAQPRYDPDMTVDWIETLMGRPHLGEDELETLHILRNTATLPAVRFALEYAWEGFRPAELLDEIVSFGLATPDTIAVKTPSNWKWRPLRGTIDAVRDYILEHHLSVGLASVVPYTRRVGWMGDATYNVYLVSSSA